MTHMTLADFEARYQSDAEPWKYETSSYEHAKYEVTLQACGAGRFNQALELGSSIGVFSARLAPRCERLTTIDSAPTAVAAARRRLHCQPHVEALLGAIPDAIPDRRYDLIIASEILYYLQPAALTATLDRLRALSAPGARLVAVHWRPEGAERPSTAAEVHQTLDLQDWLAAAASADTGDYLLDVFTAR
jgi:trans-aconitate methyltransferase